VLESYKYLFGIGAILLLFLPQVPGLGTTVNGRATVDTTSGRLRLQPGEVAKIFLIVFLARLSAREARGARPGADQGSGAPAPDLGAPRWACS
jgi:cell division protein FtsW (lipid II flippase)